MYMECQFKSAILECNMGMNVVLPEPSEGTGTFPVLYLLHGYSDNYSAWMRNSSIERYALERGFAVIMPEGYKYFYSNVAGGPRYFDFLSQELPRLVTGYFPVSNRREDRFVAGLSMGGYGAFKWALTCPGQFCGAASLSGAMDVVRLSRQDDRRKEMEALFGDLSTLQNSPDDLFYLARQPESRSVKLYQSCGTEDFLYQDNLRFRDFAKNQGLDITYFEEPGEHTWDYWDRNIRRAMDWMVELRK